MCVQIFSWSRDPTTEISGGGGGIYKFIFDLFDL